MDPGGNGWVVNLAALAGRNGQPPQRHSTCQDSHSELGRYREHLTVRREVGLVQQPIDGGKMVVSTLAPPLVFVWTKCAPI